MLLCSAAVGQTYPGISSSLTGWHSDGRKTKTDPLSFQPKPKSTIKTNKSILFTSSITESTIDAHLMTSKSGSPPLDILVRTSGVRRLSDFMLWQCAADTQIQFVSCYWPDFGIREFLPIILDYQRKVWSRRSKPQKLPEEQPHHQNYASIPGSL